MDASSTTLLQLPLFPLNTVLFPGGFLPLQIFEVRYLDMIGRRHQAGEPFGVVCLSEGRDTRQPADTPGGDGFAAEAFHPVGTLARIDVLHRPRPGLMLIECTGTQRFRIQRSAKQKFGLWVGDVELIADDAAVPVPEDLGVARRGLQALVRNLEQSLAMSNERGIEMPLRPPYRWDDCGWLANRWCEMLPLQPAVKHRFMAIDSPVLRLELVADALGQMGFTLPE
jgi:uncharacterized protein